ncbi:helix-turn-helix transcriptional regulator [uncultured Chitinophaga sp.]|jgi:AraC-type DNA-binding domain-containing proteins|uniref:helix-turn-helix domain-containing protein n=1 Tax=uncultured Chitinophaga sp. TaxID=339340 RepID=UPI00262A6444|nr:helix-turn-helix transcriptional regulator [uncultured Chitinophaga sp.]
MISKLDSIPEMHRMLGLPGPVHPLISLLDMTNNIVDLTRLPASYVTGFYKVTFVTKVSGQFRYGQSYYDFDEGTMLFTAPNQVIANTNSYRGTKGYSLIIHPDFLQGHPIARKIKQYGFFSYASNEALHLSDKEKQTILSLYQIIGDELNSSIDEVSHELVIAQLELLLSYAKRFYKRQFLTRQVVTGNLLEQLETILSKFFEEDKALSQGVPTVQYLAEQLNYTPNYLSDMLRSLTGLNAQQHIHQQLIERSKDLLSGTNMSVSEVAYQLGFEHPQSFSRLFKIKTSMTPAAFRQRFTA